jgi:hypothetical protein
MVKASLALLQHQLVLQWIISIAVGVVVGAFKFMTASMVAQKLVHKN